MVFMPFGKSGYSRASNGLPFTCGQQFRDGRQVHGRLGGIPAPVDRTRRIREREAVPTGQKLHRDLLSIDPAGPRRFCSLSRKVQRPAEPLVRHGGPVGQVNERIEPSPLSHDDTEAWFEGWPSRIHRPAQRAAKPWRKPHPLRRRSIRRHRLPEPLQRPPAGLAQDRQARIPLELDGHRRDDNWPCLEPLSGQRAVEGFARDVVPCGPGLFVTQNRESIGQTGYAKPVHLTSHAGS